MVKRWFSLLALGAPLFFAACGERVRAAGETSLPEPEIPGEEEFLGDWRHLEAYSIRSEVERDWDGSLEGMKTLWHDNGVKSGEGHFENTRKQGPWTFWFPNGQKRWQGTFVDDVAEGDERAWRETGELYFEGKAVKGKRDGLYSVWYESGKLWWHGPYQRGKRHGEFEYFHGDGSLNEGLSGRYVRGKKVTD
jgi:hypothetical protein